MFVAVVTSFHQAFGFVFSFFVCFYIPQISWDLRRYRNRFDFNFLFVVVLFIFPFSFNMWYLNFLFNHYCLVALVSCHRLLGAHRHLLVCLTSIVSNCLLTIAWWVLNPCMSLHSAYPTQLSHRRKPVCFISNVVNIKYYE